MKKSRIIVLMAAALFTAGCASAPKSTNGTSPGNAPGEHLFTYEGSADSVHVAGSFNNWSDSETPMEQVSDNLWQASVRLSPGKHSYKFVVDDKWITDPGNPNTEPDGYGGENSIVEIEAGDSNGEEGEPSSGMPPVQENGKVLFTFDGNASSVSVAGDFNDWSTSENTMSKNSYGVYTAEIKLSPGSYKYKFVADENWIVDPDNPNTSPDGYGGENSVVTVE